LSALFSPNIRVYTAGHSWQEHWRQAIRDPLQLLDSLGLSAANLGLSTAALAQFPLRVPRGFVARMRYGDADDPLLRQVLPVTAEMDIVPGFTWDAVGDSAARTSSGVLQKYRGRALLVTTGSCAIHCRYCFRRHFDYSQDNAAKNGWQSALEQLAADTGIEEVILSGGDPFSLATSRLQELTTALARIKHIQRLRIHSRLPIVLPERIDNTLLQWLRELPWPVALVIHANHAQEFDDAVDAALLRLRRSGVQLLNQAVLLRGVNDSVAALAALSRRSFQAGVLPYYLHQLDRVQGAAHFEVSDERARALHGELVAQLSGYLVPKLVREISGDSSKRAL